MHFLFYIRVKFNGYLFYFTDVEFTATVPGGIYTDLHRNNIIEDNLLGTNDVNNRWVGNQSATYVKSFSGKSIEIKTGFPLNNNVKM